LQTALARCDAVGFGIVEEQNVGCIAPYAVNDGFENFGLRFFAT
jgi:hypothetical protein